MEISSILILTGALLAATGLLLALLPKGTNLFGWFGNLPGDINYKTDSTVVFAPLASMLVVSAVMSAVLWIVRRVWG